MIKDLNNVRNGKMQTEQQKEMKSINTIEKIH